MLLGAVDISLPQVTGTDGTYDGHLDGMSRLKMHDADDLVRRDAIQPADQIIIDNVVPDDIPVSLFGPGSAHKGRNSCCG
jgi:hypothetical protein